MAESISVRLRGDKVRAARDVLIWNAANKPGIAVVLKLDDDTTKRTVTRSEAWEVCGQAVILLEGVAGGYLLNRVTVDPGDIV